MKVTHLDLFSGIGGFALAAEWAGFRTIGFVEIDKYCQKVLKKHWPDVPIIEDIRDVERIKEIVANAQANGRAGCRTTRDRWAGLANSSQNAGTGYSGNSNQPVTLITAGFPCQPFSVAGKQRSKEDNRYLWPETLAVIKAVKPKWVLLENVTGIINLALDQVLSDLEGTGYSCKTLVIPACAVNAWHRRDRVWILGFANGIGLQEQGMRRVDFQSQQSSQGLMAITTSRESRQQTEQEGWKGSGRGSQEDVADSRGTKPGRLPNKQWQEDTEIRYGNWWAVEPELGRVAHGIPHRVDRLKCLGNAIVPQVAYQILKVIAEIES